MIELIFIGVVMSLKYSGPMGLFQNKVQSVMILL